MAFKITATNKSLSSQISLNPQAILQIEGLETIFGSQAVLEFARWDGTVFWDDGTRWDSLIQKSASLDVIDLNGTTQNITQQIYPDKASSGSVSSVNIKLVDVDNKVAKLLSFDNITEILGKKADFYIGFKQGAFPEDAIPVYRGVVVDFFTENGSVTVSVASPDALKRQTIFEQYTSVLTSNVLYKTKTIQDITYEQRNPTSETVEIAYQAGGSLLVEVNNNEITVTVTGSTTADQIVKAIKQSSEAYQLVRLEVTGNGATVQTPFALTPLDIDTVLNVSNTEALLTDQSILSSYVQVNDEIMKVVSKTDTTITVERTQFGTIGANHESEDEIISFYSLSDNPIDMALKLMLSDEDNEYFLSDDKPREILSNQLIFDYYNIQDLTGLVEGDLVRLTGVNAGEYTIVNFGLLDNGSFITLDGTLTDDAEFTDTFEYKSQYNVLPDGLGMLPFQVDVQGHLDIKAFNPALFVDYRIDLKETLEEAKSFIEEQIYFPQGLYAIPRSARSSVKLVTPPLSSEVLPTLNTENVTNLSKIKQRRSLHKYLYNIYRVDFEKDEIEDKYKRKDILINNDSRNRIKGGKKVFQIKSEGFRDNAPTIAAITNILERYKDRYSFAPTYFQGVTLTYGESFNIEVGDVLPFGGNDTQIVNLQTGLRGGQQAELFEVINKSLNIKTGEVKVDLLQTSFNIKARYAVFSCASNVGVGSTTTKIVLTKTVDTEEFDLETEKWSPFAFEKIRVRSEDYTFDEEVTLLGVDPQNSNALLVETLSTAPLEGYIVEIPLYDNASQTVNDSYKLQFSHMTFKGEIDTVASNSEFDVLDASGLVIGSEVVINSPDFTRDSFGETYLINDIVGNTITLDKDLPFTPVSGDLVQHSNFGDNGYPYEII